MAIRELYRIDPVTKELTLGLHYHQGLAYLSKARFTFIIAGAQSGKTTFGPWWLWHTIYGNSEQPGLGGGDYIAATSTYDLFKLKMLPETIKVFCNILRMGKYHPGDKLIELRNPDTGKFYNPNTKDQAEREAGMWGRIVLRSAQSPGALEAMTAKAAWLDECGQNTFPYDAWEAVQRRLALNQGVVLGTTTPYNLGWLKREVYDRWDEGDKDYNVIQFPSIANPSFPREEYLRAKRTWPEWRFKMFYQGLFTRPAGLIYDCFQEATMAVKPFPIPATEGRVVVGHDFGGANTATLWAWYNPQDDTWYVFDETLSGGKSTKEHATEIKLKRASYKRVEHFGGAPSEEQFRMDWRQEGVDIQQPSQGEVEIGISDVIEMFKDKRLKVFNNLRGLLSELSSYSRVLDSANLPTNVIADKSHFHRLDCLRYICTSLNSGFWGRGKGK